MLMVLDDTTRVRAVPPETRSSNDLPLKTEWNTKQVETKTIIALFGVSLFIRLIALWIVPEPHLPTNATIAYLGGGHILLEGKGFSDPFFPVFTPPLYAVFIAMCSSLFGDEQIPVKIAQCFVDSLTVIVVYFVCKEIFGTKVALLSSALWGIYPFSIYSTLYIGTETFFSFFLSLFVLFVIYALNFRKWHYYSAAGVLLGLATLTRGTSQFFPLFFILMILPFYKVKTDILLSYAMFCLSFALVILPWTLRNYMVLGDFIPVALAGPVLLQGSSEKFLTIDEKIEAIPAYLESLEMKGIRKPPKSSKPSEVDKFYIRAALENYRNRFQNDPIGLASFLMKKFFRLWYATESGHNHGIILAINLPIYFFAAVGILLAGRREKPLAWILACVLIYFAVLHWISLPLFRYIVPVMPYVIAFGSFSIVAFMEWLGYMRFCVLTED